MSGQSAPYTGQYAKVGEARKMLFTVRASGQNANSALILSYPSPFGAFPNENIPFYTFSGMSTGNNTSVFLESPINKVRAESTGIGQFWVHAWMSN